MVDTCLMYRYLSHGYSPPLILHFLYPGLFKDTNSFVSLLQAFDLQNLTWSTIKLNTEPDSHRIKDGSKLEILPAIAGHSMVSYLCLIFNSPC